MQSTRPAAADVSIVDLVSERSLSQNDPPATDVSDVDIVVEHPLSQKSFFQRGFECMESQPHKNALRRRPKVLD